MVQGVGEDESHHVELMVTGENLHPLLPARLLVLLFHDLGIVLQNIGQAGRRQDALPQVVGLDAVRVRRISRAIVPALIEGQKP